MKDITPTQKQHFVNAAKGLCNILKTSGLDAKQLQRVSIRVEERTFSLSPANRNNVYDSNAPYAGCPLIDVYDHDSDKMIGTVNLSNGAFSEGTQTTHA